MTRSKPSSAKDTPTETSTTWDEKVISGLMPYRIELLGGLFALLAILTLLALPGWTNSGILRPWTSLLKQAFGWGAYPLSILAILWGIHITLRQVERPYRIRPAQVIGIEIILFTLLALSHIITATTLPEAHLGQGGGLVGWALSTPLIDFFGPFLTGLFYLPLFIWGVALVMGINWDDGQRWLRALSAWLGTVAQWVAPPVEHVDTWGSAEPLPAPPAQHPTPILEMDSAKEALPQRRDRRLPRFSLLEKGKVNNLSEAEIQYKKQIIEETLADFGLPAEVTQIRRGPAVTQYGVMPGYIERVGPDGEIKQQKVRIGQIASLRRDLSLALAVPRLRIQAPIPGRGVVGVEVPNAQISIVRLRDVMESDEFQTLKAPLGVALGRDVSGTSQAIDLAKMPHLLIAGTTGSGKSVCINAFISALVFNNTPEQLKLVMIDPKKVELVRYNGLPHLIGPVEVEADRAVGVLRWLTAEMDRRYEQFSQVGARNIGGYNRHARSRTNDLEPLPYIAVFIDELADLMHTYPGDVERTLCRLAQMARATGIHLIVATQRPSIDVITGLIKANFPARISFAVASGIDSRVILDTIGAEQLLGKGDMLFLASDASGPARVQGVFLDDDEIDRIVTHWQNVMPDFVQPSPPWETLIAKHALLDDTDMLLEAAIELAQKHDHLSASFLQRKLRLGYPRAARLMEHLFEMGLVEDPKSGGKTRKTYVDEGDDPLEDILSDYDSD